MEESLTLYQLNQLVRQSIEKCMPDKYWVEAELSEVHVNRGTCYVEFVQNDEKTKNNIARARGIIWPQTFAMLKAYFEDTTKQAFTAGIKVRVEVSVGFHELYGYSLTVSSIDPSFTLGDMALRRQQILLQLQKEGVIDMNKVLSMPVLPQRIAVISSDTAAGYGDFCNQLQNNEEGFYFHIELFPALMQGNQVEESVTSAMQKVAERSDEFDVLVIIRGGGSTLDLLCFDNYYIAASVAQFPIPVIIGIGHERDETVLDMIAHTSVKTPTAAAAFLIDKMKDAALHLNELSATLHDKILLLLNSEQERLHRLRSQIPAMVMKQLGSEHTRIVSLQKDIHAAISTYLIAEQHRLSLFREKISDASPAKILSKGYSITLCDGKIVKDASQITAGHRLETQVKKGKIYSKVEKTN
jgi:exodeoxyribonuclease VII large subunit